MQVREAVILIGPPGSGKSSITDRLTEDNGIAAVETGNLLRSETEKDTDTGRKIEKSLSEGKIVPVETVKEIIEKKVTNKREQIIIFDGFPRIPEQVDSFFELSKNLNLKLKKVIILELDDQTIINRLTGRRICSSCGTIYNIYSDISSDEKKCSKCGGELNTRKDDSPDVVKARLEHYKESTLKTAEYFINNYNNKTVRLNADKDISALTEEIHKTIIDKQSED